MKDILQFALLHGDPLLAIDETMLAAMDLRASARPGSDVSGTGVAVIPMVGAMGPRGVSFFGFQFPAFDTLRGAIAKAVADPNVGTIVLDMDCPGGTVDGTPETAAAVRDAAAEKPVIAVANTMAASAAYWIGSQATEFVSSPSASVGSIGVIAAHQDVSKALEMKGVNVTLVRAGKYKAEGSPYGPLTDEAKAYLQSRADEAYAQFVKDVAQGRRVSQTAVREGFGQGRVVGASAAISAGMIDRVATLNQVIAGAMRGPSTARRRRSALAFI